MNATQTMRCPGEYQDENHKWRCGPYYTCRYERALCPDVKRFMREHPEFQDINFELNKVAIRE